jgi:hypothetical protein
MEEIDHKTDEAYSIIKKCVGKKGVWASSDRYSNQCWTRDFCLATYPLFLQDDELKDHDLVKTHLLEIVKKQSVTGKIPILYLDDEKQFLDDKIKKSIKNRSISFMLQRYLDNEIENLTPHTRDSEVLFIIAVSEFLKKCTVDTTETIEILLDASAMALKYVETILVDGLIPGADWRDTRIDLNDKNVLTNACLLYQAYKVLNENEKADRIKDIIQEKYWNGKHFVDYPGSDKFDILGNALAVIYDISDFLQRELIFAYTMTLSTPYGFKMEETFLPSLTEKEQNIMSEDKAVIWPFTNGFILNAMLLKGDEKWKNIAANEFKKMITQKGFYEWYDIRKGSGYGSENQVWSAALFLRTKSIITFSKEV